MKRTLPLTQENFDTHQIALLALAKRVSILEEKECLRTRQEDKPYSLEEV